MQIRTKILKTNSFITRSKLCELPMLEQLRRRLSDDLDISWEKKTRLIQKSSKPKTPKWENIFGLIRDLKSLPM